MLYDTEKYDFIQNSLTPLPSGMSFSGADINITAVIPTKWLADGANKIIEINNIQTFSYSIHRDTDHARAIGRDTASGMVKGQAVVAGTAIFTVVKTHILDNVFKAIRSKENGINPIRIDQLPPLDIFLDFTNEVGDAARIGIFGVEFVNEGQVMSIHDLITENSVNYFATAILPMRQGSINESILVKSFLETEYTIADAAFKKMKDYFL